MSSLIRCIVTEGEISLAFHPIIQSYLASNNLTSFRGYISLDYRDRIRITEEILIPFPFLDQIYFKYINTFQQNNAKIRNAIRKKVIKFLEQSPKDITCIGGESYFYPIYMNNSGFNFYTNCSKLYEEAVLNSKFSFNDNEFTNNFKIIDYNTIKKAIFNQTIIINLSKLNSNLLKLIDKLSCGKSPIKKLIIINCKSSDFWKKIKLLNKFKLVERYQFPADTYFITVNYLINPYIL